MQSVAERNMELTLEDIRAETIAATTDLTAVLTQKARAKEDLADLRNLHQVELVQLEGHRAELDAYQAELFEKRTAYEADKEQRLRDLSVMSDKIRDALTELRRINCLIVAADDEKEHKARGLRDLDREVTRKQEIAQGILALQDEYASEEKRRDELRRETSLLIENAHAQTRKLVAEASDAEARNTLAQAETAYALNRRDHMVKEKNRICADLEIYIRRIEEKHQQEFPELRMII